MTSGPLASLLLVTSTSWEGMAMSTHVVVAGHLIVVPERRAEYLSGCIEVVRRARAAPGCLDFAISEDLLDTSRINVLERWQSQEAVNAFRGSGPSEEQGVALSSASVVEYDVTGQRSLT
jgi:quinol monooxygenase YgiN